MFRNPNVAVRQDGVRHWLLLEDLYYQGRYDQFRVPAGYRTDFATVPRAAVWLVPTYGRYTPAAILHDLLCDLAVAPDPEVSRRDADGLFRRCLRELGVPGPRRWMMWCGVRWAGRWSDATPRELLAGAGLTLLAVPTLFPPMLLVQLYLWAVWVVEAVTSEHAPTSPNRT